MKHNVVRRQLIHGAQAGRTRGRGVSDTVIHYTTYTQNGITVTVNTPLTSFDCWMGRCGYNKGSGAGIMEGYL